MSVARADGTALALGGVPLDRAFESLTRLERDAHACWIYDLDQVAERARRFARAFDGLNPLVVQAATLIRRPE